MGGVMGFPGGQTSGGQGGQGFPQQTSGVGGGQETPPPALFPLSGAGSRVRMHLEGFSVGGEGGGFIYSPSESVMSNSSISSTFSINSPRPQV